MCDFMLWCLYLSDLIDFGFCDLMDLSGLSNCLCIFWFGKFSGSAFRLLYLHSDLLGLRKYLMQQETDGEFLAG